MTTPIDTYAIARQDIIDASIKRLGNYESSELTPGLLESLIKSVATRAFNEGADWAQENPEEAPRSSKTANMAQELTSLKA